ncbi:MAG: class I SAM-dependent methyltransferase [Candidatus Binatia bacterium]
MAATSEVEGLAPDAGASILDSIDALRYRAQHYGLTLGLGVPGRVWSLLMAPRQARFDRALVGRLQARYDALLARDLDNVARGIYPRTLLHQFPLLDYLRCLPAALLDVPRFVLRSYQGNHDDLPPDIDRGRYPHYYLRTFHWQTDGWLSERSARLYDASVEFLFAGTADIMRRMAIPPVVESVRGTPRPRILDIGCGTGRFLLQLHTALPRARLVGLDLSPPYLRQAGMLLAAADVSLMADNAEAMPLADGQFDAVTSVFLFHELPSDARRRVMREAWRVLKPGGRFVVLDSAQLADSAELEPVLASFPASYHEPYYKGYLRDDLAAVMRTCGFEVEESAPQLVSKLVVGRKRARRRAAR